MKRIRKILSAILLCLVCFLPVHAEEIDLSDLVSTYALVIGEDTGEVLAAKNANVRMHPASMTKVMTAIVAIEALPDLEERIPMTPQVFETLVEENASVAGFSMYENPTVRDLLYGVALPSGADACRALALRVAGSIDAYVGMMNSKAQELGMYDTHFVNVTGITDPDHLTTCSDLAVLLHYCLQNDTFREIFSTRSYVTEPLAAHPDGLAMYSTYWTAISRYRIDADGLIGGKTGYTGSAGHCFCGWAEVNGMKLLLVTAHADTAYELPTHMEDVSRILRKLRDWQYTSLVEEGQEIYSLSVHMARSADTVVKVLSDHSTAMYLPIGTEFTEYLDLPQEAEASWRPRQLDGTYEIYLGESLVSRQDIHVEVPRDSYWKKRVILRIEDAYQN